MWLCWPSGDLQRMEGHEFWHQAEVELKGDARGDGARARMRGGGDRAEEGEVYKRGRVWGIALRATARGWWRRPTGDGLALVTWRPGKGREEGIARTPPW